MGAARTPPPPIPDKLVVYFMKGDRTIFYMSDPGENKVEPGKMGWTSRFHKAKVMGRMDTLAVLSMAKMSGINALVAPAALTNFVEVIDGGRC